MKNYPNNPYILTALPTFHSSTRRLKGNAKFTETNVRSCWRCWKKKGSIHSNWLSWRWKCAASQTWSPSKENPSKTGASKQSKLRNARDTCGPKVVQFMRMRASRSNYYSISLYRIPWHNSLTFEGGRDRVVPLWQISSSLESCWRSASGNKMGQYHALSRT